jgi:hypothetical protein
MNHFSPIYFSGSNSAIFTEDIISKHWLTLLFEFRQTFFCETMADFTLKPFGGFFVHTIHVCTIKYRSDGEKKGSVSDHVVQKLTK